MGNNSKKDMESAFLILAKSIDRNTESNARLVKGLEKLFPELEKTETVKRVKNSRKELEADARSTLQELGL
tara:strand:- start:2611 stop:2823 length:213 start_codon:yes stop_codon:yes gene_type:complete